MSRRRASLLSVLATVSVVGVALADPTVAASAPSHVVRSTQHDRQLRIRVSGLTRGHPARIRVSGPHHFHRVVRRSEVFHHVRPGVYTLRIAPTSAPHRARIYPVATKLTATVTASRSATARVRYATVVPRTTKAVSGRAITRVRHLKGRMREIHYTGDVQVRRGDVIAAGVSRATPDGLLAKVTSVRRHGRIVVRPATLLDAIPQGTLDVERSLASPGAQPRSLGHGLTLEPNGAVKKPVDGPFGKCSGKVSASVEGSISITPSIRVHASWSLFHGVTSASVTANLAEKSELKAEIAAEATCTGKRDLFAKPVTFATFVVFAGDIPIVIQPQLQVTFEGKADVGAKITASASQELSIDAGLRFDRGKGVRPVYDVTNTRHAQGPTLSSSAKVTASLNPEVTLLIDGVGGPEIGLTGGLELDAKRGAEPWWTLKAFLTGNVGVDIPLLKIDKRVTLGHKEWLLASASGPTLDLSPTYAHPWDTDVCGFYPDSSFPVGFEASGEGFAPGERVTVKTGWGVTDDVFADSSGHYDDYIDVGSVPNADNTFYRVSATGAAGHTASATIELNGSICSYRTESSDGLVTFQWGVNGFEPGTEADLYIDDYFQDSATVGPRGSGGSTTSFYCPSEGYYTYNVYGTDDGQSVSLEGGDRTLYCDAASRSHLHATGRPATSSTVSAAAAR